MKGTAKFIYLFYYFNDYFIAISKLVTDEIFIQAGVVKIEWGLCWPIVKSREFSQARTVYNTFLTYFSLTISNS